MLSSRSCLTVLIREVHVTHLIILLFVIYLHKYPIYSGDIFRFHLGALFYNFSLTYVWPAFSSSSLEYRCWGI